MEVFYFIFTLRSVRILIIGASNQLLSAIVKYFTIPYQLLHSLTQW